MEYDKQRRKIKQLRKIDLASTLSILGYASINGATSDIDGSSGYRALRRIGRQLEDYRNLSNLGRLSEARKNEILSGAIKRVGENEEYLRTQGEFYEQTRGFLKDFCMDMDKKVSAEEWSDYSSVVRDTARLYLGLNYDILPTGLASKVEDLTSLSDSEVEEEISKLIDNGRFDRACNIEDRFYQEEAERFSDEYQKSGVTDSMVKDTSVGIQLSLLLRQVEASRDKRKSYMVRYEKMKKFFDKIAGAKTIQINQRTPNGRGDM